MPTGTKILKTPLRISIFVLLTGMLARIVHWPYASQIVLVSFIALAVLYAIRFWKKDHKKFLDYVKLVLVTFWSLNGICRMLDLPYTLIFQIVTGIAFVTWFILEGTAYFMDEDRRSKNSALQIWWNIAMVMGALSIIVGSLMKVLHWEYATPLLVLGIVMVAFYILKDLFSVVKIKGKDRNNEEYQL
tara:strand:- start:303 stop:866 length:564 start_codon:yes stop_codon:yes gene_type:complete